MKQFNLVLHNIEDAEEDWNKSMPISFQIAGSILATMGFLSNNVSEDHPDYNLFQELWDILEGSEREGIKAENLAKALQIIRGSREPDKEVDCDAPEEKQGLARFILFDDDDNLTFRKEGQVKFAAKFRNFYINKLQAEAETNYDIRVAKRAEDSVSKSM